MGGDADTFPRTNNKEVLINCYRKDEIISLFSGKMTPQNCYTIVAYSKSMQLRCSDEIITEMLYTNVNIDAHLIYTVACMNAKIISYKLMFIVTMQLYHAQYVLLLEWCKLLLPVLPNMERIWGPI